MARCACAVLSAGVFLLLSASASGHGRPGFVTAYYYPSYYYPAPVPASVVCVGPLYVAPAPLMVCPGPAVLVSPPAPLYARPTAAPPSQRPALQTPEPPLKHRSGAPPRVTETRSAPGQGVATTVCCRVGFWNVSGHDVTLTVDGRERLLPSNQNVTLRLDRQFIWQVDRRSPHAEQVPADRTTLEIVIRN
jgi:hypothetical protein